VAREQLLDLLDAGKVRPDTLVWNPSLADWVPLESAPGLLDRAPAPRRGRGGRTSPLALASLVAAVVWLGGLGSAAAVVLGLLALRDMRRSRKPLGGRWMALTGLSAGAAALVLTPVAALILYLLVREPATLSAEQLSDRYKEKVYFISTSQGTGSGILIANSKTRGLIATNLHVLDSGLMDHPEARRLMRENAIKKSATVEVKTPSQVTARPARLAALHRDNDLALLIVEMDKAAPDAVPIVRKNRLKDGELAVALGYPRGLDYKVSPGAISGTSGELGAVWTTCPISPGNSGGPLFLQRQGLLAGLNTFNLRDSQNLNGAEPAEELVVPIKEGRTDKWIWASDLKYDVVELAKLVPVRD
jgi:S1-C subfamily serine protease